MSDTIKILKERVSDRIRVSDERCIACQELLRQATDLVAMSRDAIARSRDKVSRLKFKTSASSRAGGDVLGTDALQSPMLGNRAGRDDQGDHLAPFGSRATGQPRAYSRPPRNGDGPNFGPKRPGTRRNRAR